MAGMELTFNVKSPHCMHAGKLYVRLCCHLDVHTLGIYIEYPIQPTLMMIFLSFPKGWTALLFMSARMLLTPTVPKPWCWTVQKYGRVCSE